MRIWEITESQKITELFDSKADWRLTKQHRLFNQYKFEIGDQEYVCTVVRNSQVEGEWGVSFDLMDRDDDETYKASGTGNAMVVFSTVLDILKQFTRENNYPTITFSADKSEPQRVKLYGRMAQTLIKGTPYREVEYRDTQESKLFYLRTKENITELFDQKADWEWASNSEFTKVATFNVGDNEVKVAIGSPNKGKHWEVIFSVGGRYDLTGNGNAFLIMSTVGDILDRWIVEVEPLKFSFTADLKDSSRVKLYNRISKGIESKYRDYKLDTFQEHDDVVYEFTNTYYADNEDQ